MSVKQKVKRLNKRISELNKEIEALTIENKILTDEKVYKDIRAHEVEKYKDNFIKLMVKHYAMKPEHNQACMRIHRDRIEAENNSSLYVEYSPTINEIEYRVKV